MTDTLSRHCHKKRRPFHVLVSWIIFAFSTGCASVAELDRAASIPAGVVGVEGAGLAAPMTLPRFLGVDVCAKRTRLMGQIVRERVAVLVPALEPKPVALPLSHPANAGSLSPTIAAAQRSIMRKRPRRQRSRRSRCWHPKVVSANLSSRRGYWPL